MKHRIKILRESMTSSYDTKRHLCSCALRAVARKNKKIEKWRSFLRLVSRVSERCYSVLLIERVITSLRGEAILISESKIGALVERIGACRHDLRIVCYDCVIFCCSERWLGVEELVRDVEVMESWWRGTWLIIFWLPFWFVVALLFKCPIC